MAIHKNPLLFPASALIILVLLLIQPRFLLADSSSAESTANEIYYQILSPFCPGRSLADCPSTKANELKVEILTELKSGKSKSEVLDIVFQKYGDEFNSKPPLSGFAAFAWIIPIIFFLLVGIFMYRKIKREVSIDTESSNQN